MIHLLRTRATTQQVQEMLEALDVYIKVAVDVKRRMLAGGGVLHADCEAVLLEDGSDQTNIWDDKEMLCSIVEQADIWKHDIMNLAGYDIDTV